MNHYTLHNMNNNPITGANVHNDFLTVSQDFTSARQAIEFPANTSYSQLLFNLSKRCNSETSSADNNDRDRSSSTPPVFDMSLSTRGTTEAETMVYVQHLIAKRNQLKAVDRQLYGLISLCLARLESIDARNQIIQWLAATDFNYNNNSHETFKKMPNDVTATATATTTTTTTTTKSPSPTNIDQNGVMDLSLVNGVMPLQQFFTNQFNDTKVNTNQVMQLETYDNFVNTSISQISNYDPIDSAHIPNSNVQTSNLGEVKVKVNSINQQEDDTKHEHFRRTSTSSGILNYRKSRLLEGISLNMSNKVSESDDITKTTPLVHTMTNNIETLKRSCIDLNSNGTSDIIDTDCKKFRPNCTDSSESNLKNSMALSKTDCIQLRNYSSSNEQFIRSSSCSIVTGNSRSCSSSASSTSDTIGGNLINGIMMRANRGEISLTCDQNQVSNIKQTDHRIELGNDQRHQTFFKNSSVDFKLLSRLDLEHQKLIAHQCHVCGSGFEDRHRLQQHLSIHLNLHPSWFEERTIKETMAQYEAKRGDYMCKSCSIRFETTAEFDKHMQSHGEKPHCCDLCYAESKGVSFRFYRQLLTHLRSHCFLYCCRFVPNCKQKANRKDYLKLHILKHHLNNKLPECYTICCH